VRRVPVLPTVVVALAVATMIALGLWQLLLRLPEKEAELRLLAANPSRPPIAFPARPDDRLLFRRSVADCRPGATRVAGAGKAGYRVVATCMANGAPTLDVQLGTSRDPNARVDWAGGRVTGYLSHAPDAKPILASLWDRSPRHLMLVADTPPAGLARNTPPDVAGVPNNHLAYAGQWFFFAVVAALIYILALRRRAAPAV
jgi:surfeit locus 1 family protein